MRFELQSLNFRNFQSLNLKENSVKLQENVDKTVNI